MLLGSEMAGMHVRGGVVGGHQLPAFSMRPGTCVDVLVPDTSLVDGIVSHLSTALLASGVGLGIGGWLEQRPVTFWDRVLRRKVGGVLTRFLRDENEARDICTRCGVDFDCPIHLCSWTSRKLLDSELAAREGDAVVVTDFGLDPIGQHRMAAHLKSLATQRQACIVVLRGPVGGSTGAWFDTKAIEMVVNPL